MPKSISISTTKLEAKVNPHLISISKLKSKYHKGIQFTIYLRVKISKNPAEVKTRKGTSDKNG
ncbi:hypothetical protein Taro_003365 [Colocasia esculenta]|uniref:Uncharacterized protein n=1 Tax=Colocasia esculenta TaxID=4460 RepID=A0A843TJK5_COLES|nr:hypothetical protein [Colocasia esculenta]